MNKMLLLFAIVILASCGSSSLPDLARTPREKNDAMLKEAGGVIKTGDIVLRCGKDVTSYNIREMSVSDKTYSHAGVAIVKPDGVFIYHLTPPELNEPKSDTVIRYESLREFADPENNFEFGIGRFPLSDQQIKMLISHIDSLRMLGVSFDWLFDLRSKNKMYCSEMIDECIRFVSMDTLSLKRNKFKDPRLVKKVANYLKADTTIVRSRLYIPIENIHLHPAFTMIKQYKFVPDVE